MSAGYGETLRRHQLEGLCAAEEQRIWRAGRPAVRESAGPDDAGWENAAWEGALQEGPPQKGKRAVPWSDKDVIECRGCWYWRTLDYTMGIKACWYPLLEDKLRPCRPADCYRKPGTPYRPMAPRRRKRGGRRRRGAEDAGERAKGGGTPRPPENTEDAGERAESGKAPGPLKNMENGSKREGTA